MRKVLAVAVSVVAFLGLLAPPVLAQAPAPKVTITGLFDFATTFSQNWSSLDPTNSEDKEWYSRERAVFTVTGEVGATKAVWAIELDFTNGCNGTGTACTGGHAGTTAGFDLDTDIAGAVETKWLYVETPLTGPGSIMPFIPVATRMRAGAQPARGHEYKNGILLGGDFPGIALETTWAPNVKSTLTYIQIAEKLEPVTAPGATEDFAVLASLEWQIFKGLTIKPTYAYANYRGGNTGTGNLGTEPKNGFNVNGTTLETTRHTFGGDVRWTIGGFTLAPTFLYQLGTQEIPAAGGTGEVDISSYIFDMIADYRIGPLTIGGRIMYTPGMSAGDSVAAGEDVNYYQSINPAFGYMAGYTQIQTSGIEYNTAFLAGASGLSLRQSPSYDKYGRIFAALVADYAITPAFTVSGTANASWTPEKVDTDGTLSSTGLTSPTGGDDSFLGWELALGFTYRFAPNVALDLNGAYLFAGDALGNAGNDADDVYKVVARVRFTF
ncbi:MAG TPA: hypothetical protein VLF19_05620 [Methylomirabilota bacterium]|nr:hypothetical protein [Methylomirabilota bacterium]